MKTQAELAAIAQQTQKQMKLWFPDISCAVIVWNANLPEGHCALSADATSREVVIKALRQQADAMEREHGSLLVVPRK